MASGLGHSQPSPARLPASAFAWGTSAVAGVVVGVAWAVTWGTAANYNDLLMVQLTGAAPVALGLYLALSGVMMVAMMLPSALPTIEAFRGLVALDTGPAVARARSSAFAAGYFLVWTAFTALALVALAGLGLMGSLGGPALLVPGLLLVAAGAYQLTGWKQFCLRHCRTPASFLMTHWRKGGGGALRMGVEHAAYCLGCCWLLMLVLFVAGAMSLLWMGVFAGFVLIEKLWNRGEAFSRVMGLAGIAVGLASFVLSWPQAFAPVSSGMAM